MLSRTALAQAVADVDSVTDLLFLTAFARTTALDSQWYIGVGQALVECRETGSIGIDLGQQQTEHLRRRLGFIDQFEMRDDHRELLLVDVFSIENKSWMWMANPFLSSVGDS